jgi:two-component system, OmpR family, response regulator
LIHVLIVEDDPKIAGFLVRGLSQAGFASEVADDGEKGLHSALLTAFDAIIVDLMLPVLDGLTLIERLRHARVNTPVLILSAKRSIDERVRGLQAGGDDYLVKPFAFAELVARLRALIRRAGPQPEVTRLSLGTLSLDLMRREVIRDGRKIDLQPRELSLLEYLLRNANRVLTKTMIMEHIWSYSIDPQTNVVDVLICRLRNKIDKEFPGKMIRTVRGIGYVLEAH